jgi:hypothetical protein
MRRELVLALGLGLGGGCSATPAFAQATTECATARPEWVWCDDFEQDRSASYFEVSPRNGSFLRASGVGLAGSFGMRARYAAGQVDAGALHLAIGKTPQAYFRSAAGGNLVYREIWWRVWLRLEPGWTGGGARKLSRAIVFSSPETWAEAAIAHVWSGGPRDLYLVLDPARGTGPAGKVVTTKYNDFGRLRWIGSARSMAPVFDASAPGEWLCIEAHARLNDPGAANGLFELWIDGRSQAHRVGLDWVGPYSEYGWNAVFLENYWNEGSPKAQERYFDNFVVSTQAIGCGPA